MTIKVAFIGLGRMGRTAVKSVLASGGFDVVAGFDVCAVGTDIGILAGCEPAGVCVSDVSEIAEVLRTVRPDVVVDFSQAQACVKNSKTVASARANMVIGTTGFSKGELGQLKKNLAGVGAVISPNMSVGVNVFWKLVGKAAENLKGYDVEVVEAHHRFKKDAPSGTAKKAVEAIKAAVGESRVVCGREGDCMRKAGEIGVHSIRAGDIVGEHTVMFTTLGERFELRHVAHSRDSFASGIPAAIRFVKGRKGIYDMGDVLGLR